MTLLAATARRRIDSWPLPESGTLCTIPTYDGSGRTIHPSVVDMGESFSGYRWWLADTPYPNQNEDLENPSIVASNDRVTFEVPPGVVNPLDLPTPWPSGSTYNSDPELVWDDEAGQFVLLWRDYVELRDPQMYFMTSTSPDGITWTNQEEPLMTMDPARAWRSPTIAKVAPGDWRMWNFGGVGLYVDMWTATSAAGPWALDGPTSLYHSQWHGDFIYHDGVFYGLYTTTGRNMYRVTSLDGITWATGASMGFTNAYRPSLSPSTEPDYFDVWLSVIDTQRVWYFRYPVDAWPDPPAP